MNTAAKMSFRKKIALNLFELKKKSETKLHQLNYLFWECTTRCNLKCLHCGSDCKHDSTIKDMPVGDFVKVLKTISPHVLPQKTIIAITGGEPLMRADLEIAGYEIKSLGFPWGIVTNGYLMTKSLFEKLIRAGMISMAVSLDGLKQEHTWFRGNDNSFDRAVQTIAMGSQVAQKEFFFDVVTCVNKRNINELTQIKDLLIKTGVKRWRLVTIFPRGRAANNDDLKLTGEQLRQLMEFIMKTRREDQINVSFGCEGFLGGYEMEVRDIPFFCRARIDIGSVLADGSISACPSLREDFIQGNIYKDNFWDVWTNKFQIMRDRDWTRTGDCENCKVWNHCKGNSLHLRHQNDGKLLFCNYKALLSFTLSE